MYVAVKQLFGVQGVCEMLYIYFCMCWANVSLHSAVVLVDTRGAGRSACSLNFYSL